VFKAQGGGQLRISNFRRNLWRPAVADANLEGLRIHDLRHTAVALWIAAGASPKEVAARAGHTSVSFVLDRYGHLFPRPTRRFGPGWTACSGRRRNTDGTRSPRTRTP
jgi:integrase